jgi:hypothetical protein
MHKARAFFFVCAGIFLLALSYHLGARSARAQSLGIDAAYISPDSYGTAVVVVGRTAYILTPPWADHQRYQVGVPGTDRCVAVSLRNPGDVYFVLENGDAYATQGGYIGNVLGSATAAQDISVGQLKARYAK